MLASSVAVFDGISAVWANKKQAPKGISMIF